MANFPEVKSLEDIQHLYKGDTAGARWRHADNFISSISTSNGRAFFRLILREVFCRDNAVVGCHEISDQPGRLTFVEAVFAISLNSLKGCCQVRLLPGVARLVKRTVGFEEDFRRAGVLLPAAVIPFK